MTVIKQTLKNVNISDEVVLDVEGGGGSGDVSVDVILTSGVNIAKINDVPIYTLSADGVTLLQTDDNQLAVNSAEFVSNLHGATYDLNQFTLGQYLQTLTEKLGGSAN